MKPLPRAQRRPDSASNKYEVPDEVVRGRTEERGKGGFTTTARGNEGIGIEILVGRKRDEKAGSELGLDDSGGGGSGPGEKGPGGKAGGESGCVVNGLRERRVEEIRN